MDSLAIFTCTIQLYHIRLFNYHSLAVLTVKESNTICNVRKAILISPQEFRSYCRELTCIHASRAFLSHVCKKWNLVFSILFYPWYLKTWPHSHSQKRKDGVVKQVGPVTASTKATKTVSFSGYPIQSFLRKSDKVDVCSLLGISSLCTKRHTKQHHHLRRVLGRNRGGDIHRAWNTCLDTQYGLRICSSGM